MTIPLVSIIVVSYNGLKFLDELFKSITNQFKDITYELIVVDNASSDDSADYIEKNYPWIKLVRSTLNLGFTGGNNLGARYASGEFLLLLNNDTKLNQPLEPLINAFIDSTLGVIAPRLVYGDGKLQLNVGFEHNPLRIILSWLGLSKITGLPNFFQRMETNQNFYDSSHLNVDWVSGACFLTRRDLWENLAGFDEDIFMYCEDVDYCKRVRELGCRVAYSRDVTVVHYEGSGKKWIGEAALLRTFRSYLIYVQKHYGTLPRVLMVLPLSGVMAIRSLIYGFQALLYGPSERGKIALEKLVAYARVALFVLFAWNIEEQKGRV